MYSFPEHSFSRSFYFVLDVLRKQLELSHPETEGVSFVYGTILTDGNDDFSEDITDTMCVFAEREVRKELVVSFYVPRITLLTYNPAHV